METHHLSAFWDILPTLLGEGEQRQHDYLHERGGRVALRQGKWKAVRYNVSKDADSSLELYNLSVDPSEANNIADQQPEVVTRLGVLLENARTESPEANFNFPSKKKRKQEG